uniref:Uncharacterized protein n=1 Tax=Rhizophora mucronata TaxID=61149 RepID=A0A2P2PJW9_RHIMU
MSNANYSSRVVEQRTCYGCWLNRDGNKLKTLKEKQGRKNFLKPSFDLME